MDQIAYAKVLIGALRYTRTHSKLSSVLYVSSLDELICDDAAFARIRRYATVNYSIYKSQCSEWFDHPNSYNTPTPPVNIRQQFSLFSLCFLFTFYAF